MSFDDYGDITVLTPNHCNEIWGVLKEAYNQAACPVGGTWNLELLKQELKFGQGVGLAGPEGLTSFVLYRYFEEHREITALATHPLRQKKGDMRYLLSYLIERKSPSEKIWLEVHAENGPAQKLYKDLGFIEVGRRPKYYRDGGDAVLFTLALA
jgi:[ribosomal protein S18]-alanine N-acetyltransferase